MSDDNSLVRLYETTAIEMADIDAKTSSLSRDITNDALQDGRWAMEDRSVIDAITLKSLFFSDNWVFIICDLIANKISNQELRVMRQYVQNGKIRVEPADDHPVQGELDEPNPLQDYHAWMYCLVVDLVLLGNAIIWKRKSAPQMLGIPAETTALDFDARGVLKRYIAYDSGIFDTQSVPRTMLEFTPDEIIHIRRPNPSSYWWGLSPFVPGQKDVLFSRYSQEYLNSFYLKGATPGLALTMENEANETVALRLLRSFEMAYTGRRNQRRTMILPKGVKAAPIATSLADQRLEFHIDRNREAILALLKVPKHEVGIQTTGSMGSEEYKTALVNFWSSTLKPTMGIIAGAMTKAFQKELGDRYFLEFDLSDVEILQEDKKSKAETATAMLTSRTLNEVREEVWEAEPLDGGDALPSANKNPQPSFGMPAPAQPAPAQPAPGTASLDIGGKAEDVTPPDDQTKRIAKAANLVKSSGDWFDNRETTLKAGLMKAQPKVYKQALNLFGDQAVLAVKTVKDYLSDGKNYGRAYFKSDGAGKWRTKDARITNRKELEKRLLEGLNKFTAKAVSPFVDSLEATVDLGYNTALNIPFKLPAKDEIDALRLKGKDGRRAILEARGLDSFANINKTTTDKIMSIVDAGVADGKSVGEIAKDIADNFRDIDNIDSRANVIARTETMTAASLGQAAAMQDAATVIPDLQKMWVNSGDARVRGNPAGLYKNSETDHWSLQGEVVDHDRAFSNGLQFPRDPGGDPADTIQCRCTWIMLPKGQMDGISDDLAASETPYERGQE